MGKESQAPRGSVNTKTLSLTRKEPKAQEDEDGESWGGPLTPPIPLSFPGRQGLEDGVIPHLHPFQAPAEPQVSQLGPQGHPL